MALFGKSNKEESKAGGTSAASSAAWQKGFYPGMMFTVEGKDGIFFLGTLTGANAYGLSLRFQKGSMPFLTKGTPLSIRGYRKDDSTVHLVGLVKQAKRENILVGDIQIVKHPEGRNDFRLPLTGVVGAAYDYEDIAQTKPSECTIVNISRGGACISAQWPCRKKARLWLRLCLMPGTPMQTFSGVVIRAVVRGDGSYEYGLKFDKMDERRANTLVSSMFLVQRKLRNDRMEAEERRQSYE